MAVALVLCEVTRDFELIDKQEEPQRPRKAVALTFDTRRKPTEHTTDVNLSTLVNRLATSAILSSPLTRLPYTVQRSHFEV